MTNKEAGEFERVYPESCEKLSEAQQIHAIRAMMGIKPKLHKGIRKRYDYFTCGNCGAITKDIIDNYCFSCGFRILWDNPRCLTGK